MAIIQSKVDLGADPEWWDNPQGTGSNPPNPGYSGFLDLEILSQWKRGLLVVMPNGYGYRNGGKLLAKMVNKVATLHEKLTPVAQQWAILRSLPKPQGRSSDDLVAAAETAVRALARQAGDPLPAKPPPVHGGGTSPVPPIGHSPNSASSGAGNSLPLTGLVVVAALLLVGVIAAIPILRRHYTADTDDADNGEA